MKPGKLYKFYKDYAIRNDRGHDLYWKEIADNNIFLCIGFEYKDNEYGNSRPEILYEGKKYSFFLPPEDDRRYLELK